MSQHIRWLIVTSLLILGTCLVPVSGLHAAEPELSATELDSAREQFIAGLDALRAGKNRTFKRHFNALDDYALQHYLTYASLKKSWRNGPVTKRSVSELNKFEQESGDSGLTRKLTRVLQTELARRRQWSLFRGVSKSRVAANMPCNELRARYATEGIRSWDDTTLALWVQPKRHPRPCRDILNRLEKRLTPPISAIWERIFLSMEEDEPKYAEAMLRYLSRSDQRVVKRWLAATRNPWRLLTSGQLDEDTLLNRRIVVDLSLAWSKKDPKAAMAHWLSVYDNYVFFADRYYDTHRALAMRGAYRRLPEAREWLYSLEARDDDLELQEWRVRTALFAQDWDGVLTSVRELPEVEQVEDHWAYWEARALEAEGDPGSARKIFRELADLQSYYGFLSADRLDLPYAIRNEPPVAEPAMLAELATDAALLRAREYHHVGLPWEGRREWSAQMKQRDVSELTAMAVLASDWKMHDRAIFTAGRAEAKRAIDLRFPLLYQPIVEEAAAGLSLEPAWVHGVMRRESAFIADVRSSAGAIGLMQLMPNTAKYVARLQGKKNWRGDLTDVATNIDFGSFYLRHVLDKFDGQIALATASYNAGPHRVTKWLPSDNMAADIWIDSIPFTETRRYVRAVLAYTAIYEWHLTGKSRRLSDKLPMVVAGEEA